MAIDANNKSWMRGQRRAIQKRMQDQYGPRWKMIFGPDVQRALLEAEALRTIMTQALPEYEPAQKLARVVLTIPDQLWPAPLPDEEVSK